MPSNKIPFGSWLESKFGPVRSALKSDNGKFYATMGADGILRIGNSFMNNRDDEQTGGLIWSSGIQYNYNPQNTGTSYRLGIVKGEFGISKYDGKGTWNPMINFKTLPAYNPYTGGPEARLMDDGILNLYLGSALLWTSYQNVVTPPPPPPTPPGPTNQNPTAANQGGTHTANKPGATATNANQPMEAGFLQNPFVVLGGLLAAYFYFKK